MKLLNIKNKNIRKIYPCCLFFFGEGSSQYLSYITVNFYLFNSKYEFCLAFVEKLGEIVVLEDKCGDFDKVRNYCNSHDIDFKEIVSSVKREAMVKKYFIESKKQEGTNSEYKMLKILEVFRKRRDWNCQVFKLTST